jgi:hypothetical protein
VNELETGATTPSQGSNHHKSSPGLLTPCFFSAQLSQSLTQASAETCAFGLVAPDPSPLQKCLPSLTHHHAHPVLAPQRSHLLFRAGLYMQGDHHFPNGVIPLTGQTSDRAQKIVGMLAIWVYIVMPHYRT